MAGRPHPLGLQMLAVAVLILGLGFYQQYTEASGIFAPDGLAQEALSLVDSLIESTAVSADTSLDPLAAELAPEVLAADNPSAAGPSPGSSTFGQGGGFDHCSSKRLVSSRCH